MKYPDLKKTAAILCVWALAVMPVLAIDIHVATNGDDNNEGTMDAPLLTIPLATQYKVLTDDWYLFQDEWDALPVDLQGVLDLIQGDNTAQSSDGIHKKGDTYVDPTMKESGCSYSSGAVCMGQSNGGIMLNLNNGVLKLFLHAYFTADRKFKISYTLSDGTSNSITTKKYKKGSYEFDVLELLALTTEEQSKGIRTITFQQDGANGGACIYEM